MWEHPFQSDPSWTSLSGYGGLLVRRGLTCFCCCECAHSSRVPQHQADDFPIIHVPVVVTDGPPFSVAFDLHSTSFSSNDSHNVAACNKTHRKSPTSRGNADPFPSHYTGTKNVCARAVDPRKSAETSWIPPPLQITQRR